MIWKLFPLRTWLMIGLVLVVVMAVLAYCSQRDRIAGQKRDIAVAKTTGKALDQVAKETPAIRQDQKEKQDEVEAIPGADVALPDGFGRDLERVRRGERH